ncbi:MAG: NAD(P) transhydrogenase subunit alpha [Burkholderiaceae bacterium]|nr:MAG: NAD(P) transhydrogenase subunit alpha [Burkholderiaceae bacterium]
MEAINPTVMNLIIFVLAIYVGYHVVWNVTPALHTPLMAVTNAISAIIIVGAMMAGALTETPIGQLMGFLAITLASVNVFGGFLVTKRMLEMFKKKEKK